MFKITLKNHPTLDSIECETIEEAMELMSRANPMSSLKPPKEKLEAPKKAPPTAGTSAFRRPGPVFVGEGGRKTRLGVLIHKAIEDAGKTGITKSLLIKRFQLASGKSLCSALQYAKRILKAEIVHSNDKEHRYYILRNAPAALVEMLAKMPPSKELGLGT